MRFQKRNVSLNYLKNYMKNFEPLINSKKKVIIKNRNSINLVYPGVYSIICRTVPININRKRNKN